MFFMLSRNCFFCMLQYILRLIRNYVQYGGRGFNLWSGTYSRHCGLPSLSMPQLLEGSENHYLTNQPNTSVKKSTWEAKFPQSRNSPHVMEPNVHCVVYNSPPPATNLGQINSFHALSSYFLNIHFNIQHLHLGLGSDFFLSGFPTENLNTFLIFLHAFHVPHPHDLSLFITHNFILT
jgi:hypothetical protein